LEQERIIYPVTKGHPLIVPLRHTTDGFFMTAQEIRDSEALIRTLSEKISNSDASVTRFNITPANYIRL